MKTRLPERDERTVAVENAGYRWSYLTLSFGLLVISAVRSLRFHEQTWDLLWLAILGGGVNAVYQASQRVLYPRWVVAVLATVALAMLLAVAMVLMRSSS